MKSSETFSIRFSWLKPTPKAPDKITRAPIFPDTFLKYFPLITLTTWLWVLYRRIIVLLEEDPALEVYLWIYSFIHIGLLGVGAFRHPPVGKVFASYFLLFVDFRRINIQ